MNRKRRPPPPPKGPLACWTVQRAEVTGIGLGLLALLPVAEGLAVGVAIEQEIAGLAQPLGEGAQGGEPVAFPVLDGEGLETLVGFFAGEHGINLRQA